MCGIRFSAIGMCGAIPQPFHILQYELSAVGKGGECIFKGAQACENIIHTVGASPYRLWDGSDPRSAPLFRTVSNSPGVIIA